MDDMVQLLSGFNDAVASSAPRLPRYMAGPKVFMPTGMSVQSAMSRMSIPSIADNVYGRGMTAMTRRMEGGERMNGIGRLGCDCATPMRRALRGLGDDATTTSVQAVVSPVAINPLQDDGMSRTSVAVIGLALGALGVVLFKRVRKGRRMHARKGRRR